MRAVRNGLTDGPEGSMSQADRDDHRGPGRPGPTQRPYLFVCLFWYLNKVGGRRLTYGYPERHDPAMTVGQAVSQAVGMRCILRNCVLCAT